MFECPRCGETGNWVELSPIAGKQYYRFDDGPPDVYGYDPRELCHGCYTQLTDNIVLGSDISFSFYYSAASYTSRSVLEAHEEDNVLVSYRTQENGRIGTESSHFVDCGGDPQAFGTFNNAEYPTSHSEYLDYIEEQTAGRQDRWALRDYPCADSILGKFDTTVENFQAKTRDAHRELLDEAAVRGIKAQPVSILQGQTIEEYIEHAIDLREHGVLTDMVAIGGIAIFGPERQQELILAIREFLPERHRLHGLGVNLATLEQPGVLDALASADTGNWFNRDAHANRSAEWGWETKNRVNFDTVTYQYLDHRRRKNEILAEHYWEGSIEPEENTRAAVASESVGQSQQQLSMVQTPGKSEDQEPQTVTDTSTEDGKATIDRSYMDFLEPSTKETLRQFQESFNARQPQQKNRPQPTQAELGSYG